MSNSTHTAFRKAKTGAAGLAASALLAGFLLAQTAPGLSAQSVPAQPPASGDQDAARRVPVTATPTSPTSASAENKEDDEIVELSPFTVTADSSRGYTATQSLSGTRLNTDLKDIGSSITEMTVDFLKDIGATSFLDAVSYAPGTASYFSDFNDKNGNNSVRGVSYIVRGMNTTGMARDFYRTAMPLDMYNTDRLSFARGANSVLYGIADPTGIVNTTLAKPIMGRDRFSASADWASYGNYRLNIDVNGSAKLRLLRQEMPFAVRFIAFTEERPKYIKPDEQEQSRYYLAAAIQPWQGATIRGSFEKVDQFMTGGRMFAPFDGTTRWREAGAYTVSAPVNQGDLLLPGTYRNGQTALTVVTNPDGSQYVMNLLNTARPVYSEVPGLSDSRISITDYSIYPADKVNWLGLNNSGATWRGDASVVTYEQLIGRNLAFEVGFSKEKVHQNQLIPIVANFFLYTDVNERLPNGEPNPYLGVPYMDYCRVEQRDVATHTDYRATLTYTLDFRQKFGRLGKWLGRHRFVGLAERYIYDRGLNQLEELNVTPLTSVGFTPTIASTQHRVNRRTYFGPGYQPYLMDSSQAIVWNNTSRVISNVFNATSPTTDANGSINTRMFRLPNTTYRTKQVIDSALFAFQSFLANERIVFTGGLRWDTQDLYNALGWAHPETGEWSSADEMILPDDPYATNGASTGSLGLTWHVSRLFSLSWNKSENFNPPGAVFTVFDTPLPLSRGKTQDIGFKFRLLDEKITGSLNYFQAERLNERYRSGSNPYRVMALWNVVDPSMAPTLDTTAWSDTRDLRTQGYEFQVTANPSPAWRISANITQLKTEQGNLKPLTQAYFNEHEQTWLSVPQDTPCPVQGDSRNLTVADVLYYLKQDIRAHIALNGQPAYNLSEWAVNLVGNYTVQTGPLKNFNAGLAQQWRNGPLIGFIYYVDADTGLNLPDLSRKIYGTDWWNTNIWFGYERRIMKGKVRMILKLSINNLFDQRTYDMESFINSQNEVQISRYRFLTPRNFMLTATFQY